MNATKEPLATALRNTRIPRFRPARRKRPQRPVSGDAVDDPVFPHGIWTRGYPPVDHPDGQLSAGGGQFAPRTWCGEDGAMPIDPGDYFDLSMDELREVARYAVVSAEEVLPVFEEECPQDGRPRAAIDAAWTFANGARRTNLQRTTALDGHRAGKGATTEAAKHAAYAAGDAAAAAYLHPFAKANQVGHLLRAAAQAACAAESAAGDPDVGLQRVEAAAKRATPFLVDVLRRYPPVSAGTSRLATLMKLLDAKLRTS